MKNAVRHASPTQIELRLVRDDDGQLSLRISDDGKGLASLVADHTSSADLTTAPHPRSDPYRGGMGVRTMHYRTRMIGATFSIAAHPGRGTEVICRIPW